MIETERLLLRPWEVADAQALYAVAKDPLIGPPAGWPPHESARMSREVAGDRCDQVVMRLDLASSELS